MRVRVNLCVRASVYVYACACACACACVCEHACLDVCAAIVPNMNYNC